MANGIQGNGFLMILGFFFCFFSLEMMMVVAAGCVALFLDGVFFLAFFRSYLLLLCFSSCIRLEMGSLWYKRRDYWYPQRIMIFFLFFVKNKKGWVYDFLLRRLVIRVFD